VHRRHALHITVVLSKAAHSGPSVCLRARAPCPLRVSLPGADRAERAAQAAGVSVQPSCRRECAVQTAGSCASVPPWVKTVSNPSDLKYASMVLCKTLGVTMDYRRAPAKTSFRRCSCCLSRDFQEED
jgi:hypothetical protein